MSAQIDPRGTRFAAALTAVVLAAALLATPSLLATVLLVAQWLVFLAGSLRGPHRSPYGLAYRRLLRPRLGAPRELEDVAPPRFAQTVGFLFITVAVVATLSGATLLGAIATGFALAAALLNAVFGFCLGCEVYLLARRSTALARAFAPRPKLGETPGTTESAGSPAH